MEENCAAWPVWPYNKDRFNGLSSDGPCGVVELDGTLLPEDPLEPCKEEQMRRFVHFCPTKSSNASYEWIFWVD